MSDPKPKEPLIAVMLSVVFTGLGQMYTASLDINSFSGGPILGFGKTLISDSGMFS